MELVEFYKDCEIFVTGGSGVVGKALIDKLLRSCNVRRIYVLLRTKKDCSAEQRLAKVRNAKIFRLLRATKPDELNKLIAIPGDVALPQLGITPEYAKVLENVSIVFHCAATVRFDEPLKVALNLNVSGTLEALKFAETLKKLKIFMHVSTFYSNPYLKYVEPKIYPSPMDWKLCLRLLQDDIKDHIFDILTKKLITGFPNTYTFTKNLAESVVNDFRGRLPVAIYRPSIVIFGISEPEPGFSSSLVGLMGILLLSGGGILKTAHLNTKAKFDFTPQDVGIKSMLYYAWKAAGEHKLASPETVPVYMTSSCTHMHYTFKQLTDIMDIYKIWDVVAFQKCLLLPGCKVTAYRFLYMFKVFTIQIPTAMLTDLLLRLSGRPPALMGIVRKIFHMLNVMKPFMFNEYHSPGMTDIADILNVTKGTDFDITQEVVAMGTETGLIKILTDAIYKLREVLMNEHPNTLPQARKVLKIKKSIFNVVRAILAFYILRYVYRGVPDLLNFKVV